MGYKEEDVDFIRAFLKGNTHYQSLKQFLKLAQEIHPTCLLLASIVSAAGYFLLSNYFNIAYLVTDMLGEGEGVASYSNFLGND